MGYSSQTRYTPEQYCDARTDELIDVLHQMSLLTRDISNGCGNNTQQHSQNLIDLFRSLFPVVTFLIDYEDVLNRDIDWRDMVRERFQYRAGGLMGIPSQCGEEILNILDQHSLSISSELSTMFTHHAGTLINYLYAASPSDDHANTHVRAHFIAELIVKSSALRDYVENPHDRIYLHAHHLSHSEWRPHGNNNGRDLYPLEEWNVDNVISFGYALVNALNRNEKLEVIANQLASNHNLLLLPVLKMIYQQLPEVASDYDTLFTNKLMRDRQFRDQGSKEGFQHPQPFSSQINQWVINHTNDKINPVYADDDFAVIEVPHMFLDIDSQARFMQSSSHESQTEDLMSSQARAENILSYLGYVVFRTKSMSTTAMTIPISARELNVVNEGRGLERVYYLN